VPGGRTADIFISFPGKEWVGESLKSVSWIWIHFRFRGIQGRQWEVKEFGKRRVHHRDSRGEQRERRVWERRVEE
jgi:hypothetical protein